MSLCLAGARNNTEAQLKKLFNFTNLSNEQIHKINLELYKDLKSLGGNVSLNIANKIYQSNSYKVKQEYLDILKKYYETSSQGLDFSNAKASAKIINDWVSSQTNNKIQNLVPEASIDKLTKLILVNAIYFKGNWEISFAKNQTFDDLFISSDKSEKMVKMMNLNGKHFNYVNEPKNLKLSALTIPYSGGKMAMTIILPHHDQKLSEIQSKLNEHILKSILSTQNKIKINLILPKFKFEQEFEV
jgi:serine protease inhibitor